MFKTVNFVKIEIEFSNQNILLRSSSFSPLSSLLLLEFPDNVPNAMLSTKLTATWLDLLLLIAPVPFHLLILVIPIQAPQSFKLTPDIHTLAFMEEQLTLLTLMPTKHLRDYST
jgi:hypothetical protein